MIVCLAALALLILVKWIYPSGAKALSSSLTSGIDYKAAFSAMGKAITSGEKMAEVFKGITLGGFRKNNEDTSSPSPSVNSSLNEDAVAVEALGAADILDESQAEMSDASDIPLESEISGEQSISEEEAGTTRNDAYLEELLLRLPTEELDDGSEESSGDPPDTVSYDYYVIEYDYITPLNGNITSSFGYRNHPVSGKKSFHYGVDIGGSVGDKIAAFSSGTVELTGYNATYGNYLFLRHKDGIITFYGHCSKILVEKGQLVRMGDYIAKVGSTGLSTGPHLHFEIHNGDVILDPLHYVSPED